MAADQIKRACQNYWGGGGGGGGGVGQAHPAPLHATALFKLS